MDSTKNFVLRPNQFSCIYFHLGGRGFGSEVNNLLSCAIWCQHVGLEFVVEDSQWNAGAGWQYFFNQSNNLISNNEEHNSIRPLHLWRAKGIATSPWFAMR